MSARLLVRERFGIADEATVEIVIWRLPDAVRGSRHLYKYRLALVADGVCVLRYDNEAGKGDHKHIGRRETPYRFVDIGQLRADFLEDVRQWRKSRML